MKVNVYPHSPVAQEATFASGTVTFYGGTGFIASVLSDDGRFLGEAEGATEEEARRNLQDVMIARIEKLGNPEYVAAARERVALIRKQPIKPVRIADLSDGDFGHMVRQAMQEKVVETATASRDAALADKALVKAADHETLKADQEQRKGGVPMPGFISHTLHIPALDLNEVDIHAVADGRTVDVYSVLNILSGLPALDRETTTYAQVAVIHAIAAANAKHEWAADFSVPQVTAVLTPEQSAKVKVLIEVMHLDEQTATTKVLALL
jgi:hypothetical protein